MGFHRLDLVEKTRPDSVVLDLPKRYRHCFTFSQHHWKRRDRLTAASLLNREPLQIVDVDHHTAHVKIWISEKFLTITEARTDTRDILCLPVVSSMTSCNPENSQMSSLSKSWKKDTTHFTEDVSTFDTSLTISILWVSILQVDSSPWSDVPSVEITPTENARFFVFSFATLRKMFQISLSSAARFDLGIQFGLHSHTFFYGILYAVFPFDLNNRVGYLLQLPEVPDKKGVIYVNYRNIVRRI